MPARQQISLELKNTSKPIVYDLAKENVVSFQTNRSRCCKIKMNGLVLRQSYYHLIVQKLFYRMS